MTAGCSCAPPFLRVDVQITQRCNARCAFCGCGQSTQREREPDLPGATWVRMVERLRELAPVQMVCIGGGEPLLYPDLMEVVRGVNALDVHTIVVSNGSLLYRDRCQALVDAGLRQINLSIDDFAEEHNAARGIPQLFERATEAIHVLRALSPKLQIGVSTLICARNLERLPRLLRWILDELPVDTVRFQAYTEVVGRPRDWSLEDVTRDPLWPRDAGMVTEVLAELGRAAADPRVGNPRAQFDKFRDYFLDPTGDLGLRCPAGASSFAVSATGGVRACIMTPEVGNIDREDPIAIYHGHFPAARQLARFCKRSCHFLINCLFDEQLWRAWEELEPLRPGRRVLPPEARDIVRRSWPEYPRVVAYDDVAHLDLIGRDAAGARRVPFPQPKVPAVFLAGDTSEVHRWGVEMDEEDFCRQLKALREMSARREPHHTVIGVRRTNLHRLPQIYNLVLDARGVAPLAMAPLDLTDPVRLRERAARHIAELGAIVREHGVELRVVDDELDPLLGTLERAPSCPGYEGSNAPGALKRGADYRLALGPVCKDIFCGPRWVLLDIAGRCNLDCVYCRLFSPRVPATERLGFMPLETIERIIADLETLDVHRVLLVGRAEPTLHPHFGKIIDRLREANLIFNVSTNGALLHRYNPQLADGRSEAITVSLSFASEESFHLLRPGTDLKVMHQIERNVRQLADLKRKQLGRPLEERPLIIALYALCKHNRREVLEMARHAHRLGAESIWYQLVHLEDFCREELAMTAEEMADVRAQLRESRDLCAQLGLRWNSFIDFELKHYDEERGDWSREGLLHQGCYVGWHFGFVSYFGEVYFCCGQQVMGTLEADGRGLADIWRSDLYRRYRNDALVMHRENPIELYGGTLYNAYCDSCDNHDQQVEVLTALRRYGLLRFVER
jgi:MoaA/NifB/PqqE/SkfB family radical SAM enzyme